MNNKIELIVPFNESNIKDILPALPFIAVGWGIWFGASLLLKPIIGFYLSFLLQSILIIFAALILFGFIYTFLIDPNIPAAILNEDGIWVKNYCFIPWQDIDEIAPYTFGNVPIESIGIRVKDRSKLSKKSAFAGKCGVFWSRIFGYPHIIISNITVDNDQVISFAQQFISK